MSDARAPEAAVTDAKQPWLWDDRVGAVALAVIYFILLAVGLDELGYARDEGFYFQAADDYARWFALLGDDPLRALERANVDRYWRINSEHPAFIKSLFALSHSVFYEGLGWVSREGNAYRLPGMAFGSLAVGVTYLWGCSAISRFAGLVAALSFAFMPRVFHHAHLNCFDVPVAAMWLVTSYAYYRCFETRRLGWAIATGVLYGLMLNTKHNSWLFPPVIIAHLGVLRWLRPERPPWREWFRTERMPLLALGSMLTLGPLLCYATWPWIWHDTLDRLATYVSFHTGHTYYNMEFLGESYWRAPMPRLYAWVMTLGTVPFVTLLLFALGVGIAVGEFRRERKAASETGTEAFPLPSLRTSTVTLWLLSIGASYAPWLVTTTPIFGGTKHWFPAYPFLALFAGLAAAKIADDLRSGVPKLGALHPLVARLLVGAAVLLGPFAITLRSAPWGLSAYTPIVGGTAGAATLGLNRTFWGYTTSAVLPYLAEHGGKKDQIFVHDTALQSWNMMSREGRFGGPLAGTLDIARSDFALYHHEPHMGRVEYQIWSAYGTTTPVALGTHDGVPIVWLYQRDE